MMDSYLVKYRFQNSNCQTTLTLHGASGVKPDENLLSEERSPKNWPMN